MNGIFEDIFFHNPLDGWLAGRDGQLLHTTDGGQTWAIVQPGSDPLQDFALIRFLDEQTGWAVPRLGNTIFKTTDGGQTWSEYSLPTNVYWSDMDFSDDQHLWLCGGVAGHGVIVQSIDGGGEQSGDLIVTGQNTCGDVAQINFPLDYTFKEPAPPVEFSNGVLSTSVQNGATYNWYLEGVLVATTTEPYYMPTASGNWSLGIVAPMGCESELSEPILVMGVSTNEQQAPSWFLSPNPTDGPISIRHLPKGQKRLLELTDSYGKSILRLPITEAGENLEWAFPKDLPSGLYLLKLQVDGRQYARRVMLLRD